MDLFYLSITLVNLSGRSGWFGSHRQWWSAIPLSKTKPVLPRTACIRLDAYKIWSDLNCRKWLNSTKISNDTHVLKIKVRFFVTAFVWSTSHFCTEIVQDLLLIGIGLMCLKWALTKRLCLNNLNKWISD